MSRDLFFFFVSAFLLRLRSCQSVSCRRLANSSFCPYDFHFLIINLSVWLSVCLSVCLSVYWLIFLMILPLMLTTSSSCKPLRVFVSPSFICLSECQSICPSVFLSFYLSVHPNSSVSLFFLDPYFDNWLMSVSMSLSNFSQFNLSIRLVASSKTPVPPSQR